MKEPLGSEFVWVCEQPQFPPTADCFISCSSETGAVSQLISFPTLQAITHTSTPSLLHQCGGTSRKGDPGGNELCSCYWTTWKGREMRPKPRSLIFPCDDQGASKIPFFFPFGTSEVKRENSQRQMRQFSGGSGLHHKSPSPGKVLLQEFLG